MTVICVLIWTLLCCCFTESRGQVTVTQPAAMTSAPGGNAQISCTTSQALYKFSNGYFLSWFQQKAGESPKALIHGINERVSGISSRFLGSGSGSSFTLTISEVMTKDAAVYYCQGANYINSVYVFTQ
ncbi:unnamed protein product [Xyrichtys novacula]|uniref:Unnamed protein product n=1 Tax=Xyrichtys novacula TaxID=13765 RepID=A0AAV1HDB5_XYRNO|nr:unnamed protein product [Xyrichtys novacula]